MTHAYQSYGLSHIFACCVLGYSVNEVVFNKQISLNNGRNKTEILSIEHCPEKMDSVLPLTFSWTAC